AQELGLPLNDDRLCPDGTFRVFPAMRQIGANQDQVIFPEVLHTVSYVPDTLTGQNQCEFKFRMIMPRGIKFVHLVQKHPESIFAKRLYLFKIGFHSSLLCYYLILWPESAMKMQYTTK